MVISRSQADRQKSLEPEKTSDNESEQSVPGVLSRAQLFEFDESDLLNKNFDFENNNTGRRFSDMMRQIGDLANIVLSFTERLSSNARGGNGLNTLSTEPNVRCDSCPLPS